MRKSLKPMLKIKDLFKTLFELVRYVLLIPTYIVYLLIEKITFLKFLNKPYLKFLSLLDDRQPDRISKIDIIDLSIQNMTSKKNRFLVTVGGMTVGIAGIVFLVSIGYGLQSLVVNRVARLEEMKQAEVSVLPGSKLFLNDENLDTFNNIENVELVLPQIAVVGKVNLNNSVTDMAAYGVTREYLKQSAVSPTVGKIFESNELKTDITATKEVIEEEEINESELTPEQLEEGFVNLEGESEIGDTITYTKVQFPESMEDKEAVVNRSFLRVLDIKESDALGTTFSVVFISTNKSLEGDQIKIESTPIEYEIVGVSPDDTTPLFYVPFIHLRVLGITNYSQVKIVAEQENNLTSIRQEIEANGYSTSSVVDTVAEIEGLFSTVRAVLGLLGAIALIVAGLGMFNTLTVSLLERTREIGLLKAMGMRPDEVRDLFLAESMLMGSLGGFLGITFGFLLAKILELGLSAYAMIQGAGSITIVDMPITFTLSVILISFLVGVITGIYPARRAKKISALNALRYE
jgi:ABC-type antimicrobial peptide transport system permease subunit